VAVPATSISAPKYGDPSGVTGFFLDIGRGAWNAVVDTVEGAGNLVTGAIPGGADYVPFLNGIRADYDTPGIGNAAELLFGLGAFKALGEIGELSAASRVEISGFKVLASESAEEVNQRMRVLGNNPAWLPGTSVESGIAPRGSRFQMVVTEDQANALSRGEAQFGSWGTTETVPSQEYARDRLAILPQYKSDVSRVVTVETTGPQALNRGIVNGINGTMGKVGQVQFTGELRLKVVALQVLPPR
jgi:hypothetical protein